MSAIIRADLPEGVNASEVVGLVTELLKAAAEARIIGRFDIAHDLQVGGEHWRVRVRGHRKGKETMPEKQAEGGGYVMRLAPEHEEALRAHLEAAHGPLPEGLDIGAALSIGFKVVQFVGSVAAGGPADATIKGINIGPAHGALTLHWTPKT